MFPHARHQRGGQRKSPRFSSKNLIPELVPESRLVSTQKCLVKVQSSSLAHGTTLKSQELAVVMSSRSRLWMLGPEK